MLFGQAAYIPTGGMLPAGADAVVNVVESVCCQVLGVMEERNTGDDPICG